MNETDKEMLKVLKALLTRSETQLFDHLGTTFRWLMATLFAANGGSILALLHGANAQLYCIREALAWFAAGMLLSILMGALSTLWGQLAYVRLYAIRLKVEQSLILDTVNDEIVPALIDEKPTWKTWVPSYAGVLSFTCLLMGILTISGCI